MKKNNLLLVSWILTVFYFLMLNASLSKIGTQSADAASIIALGLVSVLVFPHLILVFLGGLFNILGWALNKKGFALTGAILYSVAMVFMIPLFYFLIIQTVLSYVGYATMDIPDKPIYNTKRRNLDDYRSL
jgi:hypothetical protein